MSKRSNKNIIIKFFKSDDNKLALALVVVAVWMLVERFSPLFN